MDLLEKYKESWKNQPEETHKISKVDIYKMAHKKSSSIVKWIFIIGIAEFLFWLLLSFFFSGSKYMEVYDELNLKCIVNTITIIHYIAIVIFLTLFFLNYKAVSIVDNTKSLIKQIIKVRKTVKTYVYFNIIVYILSSIIIYSLMFSNFENLKTVFKFEMVENNNAFLIGIISSQVIVIIIFTIIIWAFYKLLYGTLLQKLNRNYKELSKLDELN